MNKTGKTLALLTSLLIILAFLILPIVDSVNAQTASKPSVPEFTITFVDNSYDIPPTYGIDQYTGQTVIKNYGEHVDKRTVEITIKNSPFTPFNDSSGNMINRFFDVRYKGSYGDSWTTLFSGQTQTVWYGTASSYIAYGYPVQNYTAQYTKIIYQLSSEIPTNCQMNFQVQTLDGYTKATSDSHIQIAFVDYTFYGKTSDWSNTQTISFPDGNVTSTGNTDPSPNATQTPDPTPAPSVPEFSIISLLPLFVVLLLAVFLVKSKTRFLG